MVKVRKDMTGWVLSEHGMPNSRITVLKQTDDYIRPDGRHEAQWICQCSCGSNPFVAIGHNLTAKVRPILSCGCLLPEVILNIKKKTNIYSNMFSDEYGDYYIGYATNTGSEFYIDVDDFERIRNYCWIENSNGYMETTTKDKKHVKMHRLIMNNQYDIVDHADRNRLNNRKYNLRDASNGQNAMNRSKQCNNTSEISGVSWDSKENKWVAKIDINKKRKHLGYFINKEDAIIARLKAEKEYFGEFAPQRHLFDVYDV